MVPSQPPDVTTETKSSVTRTSGLSLNSQEGQQIMYLSLFLLSIALLVLLPALKEQATWLFGAASGALFAKSKQS
jgi:hypothetical protein